MIEYRMERLEGRANVGKINDPTALLANFAAYPDFNPVRVSMKARALVTLGHIREAVRRLECEFTEYFRGRRRFRDLDLRPIVGNR